MTSNTNAYPTHNWSAFLTGEILLFELLGRLTYQLPDRAWLQSLIDGDTFADVPFAAGRAEVQAGLAEIAAWAANGLDDQAFKRVQVDYTVLFSGVGVMPVAPWESVYFSEERLVFQEETLDVRAWYRRYGLEAEKLRREPDDHIGLELGFLAHLARAGLAALKSDQDVAFRQTLNAQAGFLESHLLRWAPRWAREIVDRAETGLYRGVALILNGALSELAEVLDVPLPASAQA